MYTDNKPIGSIGKYSGYGSINESKPSTSSLSSSSSISSCSGGDAENIGAAAASSSSSSITTPDDSCDNIPIEQMRSTITACQKIGYSFGHMYNDLCAGVWFSYTLLFLQGALSMPGEQAGALVMLGQIGDAIATPIVGILADKYGTKRKWHIAGTGLVFVTFPLIFSICPFCSIAFKLWPIIYFSIVILLFQFGWAIVQITHLAMIPELARTRKDRSDLTAVRYSASVCSNVTVYIVTWAVLHARNKTDHNIGPQDAYRFRDISMILSLVGITMTVLFYFSLYCNDYSGRRRQALSQTVNTTRRRQLSTSLDNNDQNSDTIRLLNAQQHQQKNFFKTPLLYQNAFLYVFSRLFMTTALIYIPLWLDERSWTPIAAPSQSENANLINDNASVEHIATVPLVSFIASFVASIIMKLSTRFISHRIAYLIGSLTSIIGCVLVALAVPTTAASIRLYGIAILFGGGSSITMISSLCITADMIGRHANQGGFIYSAVTFSDKLITGIVIITIETLKCDERKQCPEYYKNVLSYACASAAILGVLTLLSLQFTRRSFRSQINQIQS